MQDYPFIYINHGKPVDIYSFQGEKYLTFCFKEKIDAKIQNAIEKAAPKLIKGSFLWSDTMMMNYSISDEDEIIMYYMKKRGNGFDSELNSSLLMELYTDFVSDIEAWAVKVNEIAPILLFKGLNSVKGSDWDNYSESKLDEVIDLLSVFTNDCTARERQIITETISNITESKNYILTTDQKKAINAIIVKLTD